MYQVHFSNLVCMSLEIVLKECLSSSKPQFIQEGHTNFSKKAEENKSSFSSSRETAYAYSFKSISE